MKVLVIGKGGREHALVWKIRQSSLVDEIFCAPGNDGMKEAIRIPIGSSDIKQLAKFAKEEKIGLTVVGPEKPLALGIVDFFNKIGLKIFGPTKRAAKLEKSKIFAKKLMKKYHVPTASYAIFHEPSRAINFVKKQEFPFVIKADGLAGGKGVKVCHEKKEALNFIKTLMIEKSLNQAGKRILIEQFLDGEEASFMVFSDGKNILPMPTSQDHKTIFDNDQGSNTGGMGAYSPVPLITEKLQQKILGKITMPIVNGLRKEGIPYRGVLYAGLMICDGEPHVLEINVRLGDPETQPILARLKSDIVPILLACTEGHDQDILSCPIEWDKRSSVCVVMASSGYPEKYQTGMTIQGIEKALKLPDIMIFHAGTKLANNFFLTNGGRVLGVTGLGKNIAEAIVKTYSAVYKISWPGVHFRTDIAHKSLKYQKK
ncbi:MAG: phosphoribosylamine--glycine ligase [bacterium]